MLRRAESGFAEFGYSKTSIDEIVKQEQLTKGAVYYYFKDKRDLFEQVVNRLLNKMVDDITGAIEREEDPWRRVLSAVGKYLEGCLQPAYRNIVLREAPVILGWTAWREKEKQTVAGVSTLLLQELMEAGLIRKQPLDLLTGILFGVITEAAIGIAESPDPAEARQQAELILIRILKSL